MEELKTLSFSNKKPIKIVFENNSITKSTRYGILSELEVSKRIVRNMWSNNIINTVTYRTLKGQLKHGNLNDVVNFIRKHNYGDKYDKYSRITILYSFTQKYSLASESIYGIVEI